VEEGFEAVSHSYDSVAGIRLFERARLAEGTTNARSRGIDLCVRIASLARDLEQLATCPSGYTTDEMAEAADLMDAEIDRIREHITGLKKAVKDAQTNDEIVRGL
jgi:hypothetical protein